jgi:chromosome segregation ATPase
MDPRRRTELIDDAMQRFRAIVEADVAVSRQVRKEVNEMEDELRHVREARDQLSHHVQQGQQAISRSTDERRQLEDRLDDAKMGLAEIREDRRGTSLDGVSMRRDHDHFQEELQFLQRMMTEERAKLEECYRSNQMLETSYRGLEMQTSELEHQRHLLMKEVSDEEASLRAELRHNAEMRTKLQQMWREQHSSHLSRQEAYLKEQRYREMQGEGGAIDARASEALAHPDDSRHSWAAHVSAPSDPRTAWVS